MKSIIHNRKKYYSDTTIGYLVIDGQHYCYTLEDTVRPSGIKVKTHTAIPENNYYGYKVGIRYSNKFDREVLCLHTEDDGFTLKYGDVKFKYIYSHGGNDDEDTLGCVLVGYNNYDDKIQGTAERDLFKLVKGWIDSGEEVRWFITNFKQAE